MMSVRLIIIVVAIAGAAPSAFSTPSPPPPTADKVLRGIDWCNRGYGGIYPTLSGCRGSVDQRHRPGEGIWGVDEYKLANVVYGDLTGDGREDALLVLETSLRPVLIQKRPPPVRAAFWLIERRGTDLVLYTTESADNPPASVSIANGVATLAWNQNGQRCTERWRFGGEGRTAVKAARTCATTAP